MRIHSYSMKTDTRFSVLLPHRTKGKVEEEPTIIQIAVEEALDGPPLFPHYQRRRSSVATIPRCSIPNMDMIIDQVRRQSIQVGFFREQSDFRENLFSRNKSRTARHLFWLSLQRRNSTSKESQRLVRREAMTLSNNTREKQTLGCFCCRGERCHVRSVSLESFGGQLWQYCLVTLRSLQSSQAFTTHN